MRHYYVVERQCVDNPNLWWMAFMEHYFSKKEAICRCKFLKEMNKKNHGNEVLRVSKVVSEVVYE